MAINVFNDTHKSLYKCMCAMAIMLFVWEEKKIKAHQINMWFVCG